MKHTLQRIIFLMVIFIATLVSCQNDDYKNYEAAQSSSQEGVKIKVLTFEEFKNYKAAFEEYEKFSKPEFTFKTQVTGNDGEDYYYETDEIWLYEYRNENAQFKTFIFPIYRKEPRQSIENIVIWENEYEETESWLFTYNLDESDLNAHFQGNEIPGLPGKVVVSFRDRSGDVFLNKSIWQRPDGTCYTPSWGNPLGPGAVENEECSCYENPVNCPEAKIDLSLVHPGGGGAGGGSFHIYIVDIPSNPGSGTPPSGSNPPVGGGYVPTLPSVIQPVIPYIDLINTKMYSVLDMWEEGFYNSHSELKEAIRSFILQGNFSNENYLICQKLIQLAMQDTNSYNHALQLLDYLKNNSPADQSDRDFIEWAIDHIINNPNVTPTEFKNRYLKEVEGPDGEYDAAYWDNPNLTFVQQDLPSWEDFKNNFPLDTDPLYNTPQKMYQSIGGDVATIYSGPSTNTCAVRLSKALNYSGVDIPHIEGKTFKGADDKYYFKAAYEINLWMRKTFGTNDGDPNTPYNPNHYHYTGAQAGENGENLFELLLGKKGIYSLYSSNFTWASGHADLLYDNSTCGNGCHFDGPIAYIDIWVLQ